MTLTGQDLPEAVGAQSFSVNALNVLGVPPLLGRVFNEADGPAGEQYPTCAWAVQPRLKRGVNPRMAEQRLQPLFDQFAKEAPQRFPKGVRPLVRSLVAPRTA